MAFFPHKEQALNIWQLLQGTKDALFCPAAYSRKLKYIITTYLWITNWSTPLRTRGKLSLEHCIPLSRKLNQCNYHCCGFIVVKIFYTDEALRKGLMSLTLIPLDHNPIQTSLINIT